MHKVGVALFFAYFGEGLLLIANAVALTFKIIVTGKPLIKEGCHVTGFFVIRLSHKSSFPGQPDSIFSCVITSRSYYTAPSRHLSAESGKVIYSFRNPLA